AVQGDLRLGAEASLLEFIRQGWTTIEPGTTFLDNWHIGLIAEHLEAIQAGAIRRLIINIPPRYMKSLIVSVFWPTWTWLRWPESRWMFASYSASLSTLHSVLRRYLIQSAWYQEPWGEKFKLLRDQNLKTEFANNRLGMMVATSVGGTSTGKGADILVADDPINPTEADSDVQREAANTWFSRTYSTRLNDKKRGAMVVIMQRLHERDLTGMLLEQGGWEHLCIPAEAEERKVYSFPMTGAAFRREPGDILWTEREGPEELARQQIALGAYAYAGQYQQRPAPAEGGIFKRHWWRFWYPADAPEPYPVQVRLANGEMFSCPQAPLPADFQESAQSWDMAFKGEADSCDVCGQVWARKDADFFLLEQRSERLDIIGSIDALLEMSRRFPAVLTKWIEDTANGPAIIQMLRKRVPGLIPVAPLGGKPARAKAVSPLIEAGNVYLPHPSVKGWVDSLITIAMTFPAGKKKDPIDAMSQALLKLSQFEGGWWMPPADAGGERTVAEVFPDLQTQFPGAVKRLKG
ncbi:MAG TPA: phage terminase large subunit, partial [Armatimonadota bacterium]